MGARPVPHIAGVIVVMILAVPASVQAQMAPPATEAPAAGVVIAPAPAPDASPTADAPAATPPPETPPKPEAELPAGEASPAPPPSETAPMLRAEQLDQLLAPIALYPDALLAQILIAATYPLEIVKANRWLQDPRHAASSGDELAAALDAETWDPSIKALTIFPQILRMMDANLDWTEALGDAFAGQQADVMDAVQRLRQQAAAAGTLWSNAQQGVTEEGQGIAIEPANSAYIYPPLYNPALVYGPWPYPEYPPVDIVPPDYGTGFASPLDISFGAGFVIVKKIWRWCAFDWGQRRIRGDPQISKAPDHPVPRPESAIVRHSPAPRQGVPFFDLAGRERLGGFRTHPVSAVASPQIPVPRAAGAPPAVMSHPVSRSFTPVRMGPTARILPGHGITGRPMMLPRMAPRQPAAWPPPRAVIASRAVPVSGGQHSDGTNHR
jgi:hypothetical protein